MGAVTGKGLADLIRENFGVKLTFYLMLALLASNYGNTVSEFAGVAASLEIFGVREVDLGAARGDRDLAARRARHVPAGRARVPRRVRLLLRLPGVGVPRAPGLEGGAPRHRDPVARSRSTPATSACSSRSSARRSRPWMQFYLQSSVVEKGIRKDRYWMTWWDVVVGCIVTDVVAFFIIVACAATLFAHGIADHERRRRRPLARAAGRPVRLGALRVRPPERLGLLGRDPAALDRLLRLRGLRLGGRRRQEVRRGAGLLLASTPR